MSYNKSGMWLIGVTMFIKIRIIFS